MDEKKVEIEKEEMTADLDNLWEQAKSKYLDTSPHAIKKSFINHMEFSQAKTPYTATNVDSYKSLAYVISDRLMERWNDTQETYYKSGAKRVYYFSLEYLMGRALGNNIINLNLRNECGEAMKEIGYALEDLQEHESDAGLGNGGLGRLAACFLDSMATLQLPGTGYGLKYDFGMFEQKIKDGHQVEVPDHWLRNGNPWQVVRPEYTFTVDFYGETKPVQDKNGVTKYVWANTKKVNALALDYPIPGYRNNTVNNLRLWSAEAVDEFDLDHFNKGDYISAVLDSIVDENISRVLYPKDDFAGGKELRLKQEYFLVSASLQDIIRRYNVYENGFDHFHEKVAIQLNDTHPVIAIPELMRIFLDQEELTWEQAWSICNKTFAYTNHTVLPEALEKWPVDLVQKLLPRHMEIIYEINHRFLNQLKHLYDVDPKEFHKMSIIEEGPVQQVRMANLAIIGSHSVNGVAALHSEIIKDKIFNEFYTIWPKKFNNKTNGITQRRWLKLSNPRLSKLISDKLGNEDWVTNLDNLKDLKKFIDDNEFLKKWRQIKQANKRDLAKYILDHNNIEVDINSIFDCQIKRFHEYKRQLLNVLHIITLYNRLKQNPNADITPRTFIFSGKAAPGYYMAKLIIKLINSIADVINNDSDIAGRIKVVFLANYGVSLAQKIISASDLSEQISTAGMEASGTGNMKLALNGSLTVGTLDGANVEIKEEVGDENIYIFGLTTEEVRQMRESGYNPHDYYNNNPELHKVINLIRDGFFSLGCEDLFKPIVKSLLDDGDHFMLLADYESYIACQDRIAEEYKDEILWTRKSLINTAQSGKFSSDRTIKQYAEEIWNVHPVPPTLSRGDRD